MKPLLSIVIPVYNKEKYLNKCIDSVLNQDFKNFELILIDDGSTDNSNSIINSYSDMRIKKYQQSNKGVSYSRNLSLSKAIGNYVWFVDADDEIELEAFDILREEIEINNPDIILFQHKENQIINYNNYKSGYYTGDILNRIIENAIRNSWYSMLCVWKHIYKRELIKNISFINHNKVFGEDILFNEMVYPKIKSLSIIPYALYNYNKNEEGLSFKQLDVCDGAIESYLTVKDYYLKNGIFDKYKSSLINNYLFNVIIGSGIKNKGALTIIYALDKDPHNRINKIINSNKLKELINDIPNDFKMSYFEKEVIKAIKNRDENYLWILLSTINTKQ